MFEIHEAKLTLPKDETDKCTIMVGDFNAALSGTDSSSIQNIIKDTEELNNTTNQLGSIHYI